MLRDIDIFIGLMMEAKDGNYNPAFVIEKATWFNSRVTTKQRKDIILPIVQSKDPVQVLHELVNKFLSASKIRQGVFQ